MTVQEHLIMCVAEECAEIIQVCSKINRFGLDNNKEKLVFELNDLMGTIQLLQEHGVDLDGFTSNHTQINDKVAKVKKFMHIATELGTLQHTGDII